MEQWKDNCLETRNEGIEIRLWEIYLLRNRTGLYMTLSRYAIDNGPVEKSMTDRDMVTFRFTMFDWKRNIEAMLVDQNIPFWVHTTFHLDTTKSARKRVLVAEDDPVMLSRIDRILKEQGFDVSVTSRAGNVVGQDTQIPDVIILDKRAPDAEVLRVCRQLRAHPDTKATPVIMVSATKTLGEEAKNAGATDVLTKPFAMEDLLRLVNQHTGARQPGVELAGRL